MNEFLANSSYWNSDIENYPKCHNAVTLPCFNSSVLSCVNTLLPICHHKTGLFKISHLLLVHRKSQTMTVLGHFELLVSVLVSTVEDFSDFDMQRYHLKPLQWKFMVLFVFLNIFPSAFK